MRALIESGAVVHLILVLVGLEAAVLIALWRLRRRGIAPLPLLSNLGAGVSLLLAFRATLLDHDWRWTAAWLLASLLFHLADLRLRWTRDGAG